MTEASRGHRVAGRGYKFAGAGRGHRVAGRVHRFAGANKGHWVAGKGHRVAGGNDAQSGVMCQAGFHPTGGDKLRVTHALPKLRTPWAQVVSRAHTQRQPAICLVAAFCCDCTVWPHTTAQGQAGLKGGRRSSYRCDQSVRLDVKSGPFH